MCHWEEVHMEQVQLWLEEVTVPFALSLALQTNLPPRLCVSFT